MQIGARISVGLTWNDDSNEWELDASEQRGDLGWALWPYWLDEDGSVDHPDMLTRAIGHTVSAEDLAHMLGFAMVRATAPANADVHWRPASPSLVGMLKDTLRHVLGHRVSDEVQGTLVRNLIPIISSVDENAHRRGMADQRRAAVAEEQS